jgi:SAM-dependent methyltransferase
VLDAGCGTGRVSIRLAELGHRCLGVDADVSMLAVARQASDRPSPGTLAWMLADLAELDADDLAFEGALGRNSFDLVFAAGNVVPLLAAGALPEVVRRLAALLAPGALLVAGFGLDRSHLPAGCPVTPLSAYRDACAAAGLSEHAVFAGWDAAPLMSEGGYTVSVHGASGPRDRRPIAP